MGADAVVVGSAPAVLAAVIRKDPATMAVRPNLVDYAAACAGFTWEDARAALAGLPRGGGLNIAHECVDRHATGPFADRAAFRFIDRVGVRRDVTYADLRDATNRFANVLATLGIEPGERVFFLLGRVPELYIGVLGTLKHRAVACTLFSAFGPEPVRQRVEIGAGRVLVTTAALYRRKIAEVRAWLPTLRHVLIVGDDAPDGCEALGPLMAAASPRFTIGETSPEDRALLHFTSGTTGTPKGAVHVHEAILAHYATAHFALDLHPDDVFWCTADPGWVTGTSYGIIAPLAHGLTSIVDEGDFDAERWYGILREERVSVWYTAPTAVRMMMRSGAELAREYELPDLRFIASVGEPLNPEAVRWGLEAFGLPIHDNWWQTETGAIMIANLAAAEIRPGSMGRPLPGVEAAILKRDERGRVIVEHGKAVEVDGPMVEGELALRPGWPSMFRGYLNDEVRTTACFVGGWYLTGDLAMRDVDGYIWFVGRADDVIKSSGHLIGPFEVESALLEHPAVAEAGVIGKPDPIAGEVVKAFVSLRSGYRPCGGLRDELIGFARKRLGPAVAPREITFSNRIPKTRSGKIVRRLLRARELGLSEGDVSTLEEGA
jgi:acetyl-CoA synthetase